MPDDPLTEQPIRRKNVSNKRPCRRCGIALITSAEEKLGIHIGCVAELNFSRKPIRGPSYGFNRKPDR